MHDSNPDSFPSNDTFQMHQAGHITGRQNLGPRFDMIVDSILPHHARHRFLGDSKCSAEAAAFVLPREFREPDAAESGKQILNQTLSRLHHLGGRSQPQFSQPMAALVKPDLVSELTFGRVKLQDIYQELA